MADKKYVSHLDKMRAHVANPPAEPVRPGQHQDFFPSYGNPFKAAVTSPVLGAIVAAANYLSPTVRQHAPLTAIDDHPHPLLGAVFGDLLRVGRKIMGGSEARTYGTAVLDRRQQPINERDFTPQELSQLAVAVGRARAAGRDYIAREDYHSTMDQVRAAGGRNPTGVWNQTVGRAKLVEDPQGRTHVVDSYDFNKYDDYGAGIGNPLELLSPPTWLGRRALPSGLRGTPVDIQLGLPRGRGK